jgi:hypothetical protein
MAGFIGLREGQICINLKLSGEAASANNDAASTYRAQLAQLIAEGGYCTHQVFNVDETGKKMPARTFTAKEERNAQGYKPAKDRLTLLLGSNTAGDFKLKPLLVYHSKNPKAFKGKVKNLLSVIWRSNSKAWVTITIFQD